MCELENQPALAPKKIDGWSKPSPRPDIQQAIDQSNLSLMKSLVTGLNYCPG
jgi:hypothetical protein